MKVQVKRGFVNVNGHDYFHPSMSSLSGRYVEIICGLSRSRVDVYWHGKFYCEAAYVPTSESAVSPMRPAEKGRIEREFGRRMRQPAFYPMADEFPSMPEAYRCRSAIRSEDSLWREMRRTARRYHQMRQGTVENKEKIDMRPVLISIREGLDSVIRLLDEEAEGKI